MNYKCYIMIELTLLEGIDVKKKSESKECDICHHWDFLDKGFEFQSYVCNECHDLLMMSINLSDNTVLNIHGANGHCIISDISKNEAVNLLHKADSDEKSGTL